MHGAVDARGWGQGRKSKLLLNGDRVSGWNGENVLEMDGGDGHITM